MTASARGQLSPREDDLTSRSLLARGGYSFLGGAMAGLLGLLLAVVVGNGFGPEGAGVFFSTIAVALVLSNICELGADTGFVWILPRLRATGRLSQQRRIITVGVLPVIGVSIVAATSLAVLADPIAGAMSGGSELARSLRVVSGAVLFGTLATVTIAILRGLGRLGPYIALQNLLLPGLRLLGVACAVALGLSVSAGVAAWVAAWVVVFFGALGILVVVAPARQSEQARATTAESPSVVREFWRFTVPRGLSAAVEIALVWLDVIMVSVILGPAEAGVYAVVSRFVTTGSLGENALRIALAPRFSALFSVGDRVGAERLFRSATPLMVILTWPVFIMVVLFGPVLLGIFGQGFQDGWDTLIILSSAMLLVSLFGPIQPVLLMSGNSSYQLANKIVALLVQVTLNLFLIPILGIKGAGLAWGAALVVDNGLAVVEVRLREGVRPDVMSALGAALLVVAAFGAGYALAWAMGLSGAQALLVCGTCGSLLLAVCLGWIWRARGLGMPPQLGKRGFKEGTHRG